MDGGSSSLTLQLRGTLRGHNGWVTQIATNPKDENLLISGSRGLFLDFRIVLRWIEVVSVCCFLLYVLRRGIDN